MSDQREIKEFSERIALDAPMRVTAMQDLLVGCGIGKNRAQRSVASR